MSESQWVKQGGTFSHKNACKEFGLKEEEIIDAMKAKQGVSVEKANDLSKSINALREYYIEHKH